MKSVLVVIAAALCFVAPSASAQNAAPACDRACLNGFVDQYLAALVAKDAKRLPLAPGARYTENGVELELTDGIWGIENKLLGYRLDFADPRSGNVGAFVTLEGHGHPGILGIRLKIDNRRISEMEAIVIRSTSRGSFSDVKGMIDRPILKQALTPAERRSRDELITASNAYFEGMEQGTDKVTPFDPQCQRVENGVPTALDPTNTKAISRISCGAQFATGFTRVITNVRERRFPIVDEDRGLVLSVIRFDHNGRNKTIKYNDGSVHPVNTPFDEPFSFMIFELFKVQNGKLRQIEALVLNVPYGMPTGWVKK